MKNNIAKTVSSGVSPFDSICHVEDGAEVWYARELQKLLGYIQWRRFEGAIDRATVCLENIGASKPANVSLLPGLAKLANLTGDDYKLSRLACYLIAMNGDPRKPEIAAAQSYFAIKTREAEILASQAQIKNIKEQILELEYYDLEIVKILKEAYQNTRTEYLYLLDHLSLELVTALISLPMEVIDELIHRNLILITKRRESLVQARYKISVLDSFPDEEAAMYQKDAQETYFDLINLNAQPGRPSKAQIDECLDKVNLALSSSSQNIIEASES